MNKQILDKEVQEFIRLHLHDDITHIALQKSPFPGLASAELAVQIDSKKRCEKKLPLWFATSGIYFPPKLNIEQASSELTAQYKSRLVKGNVVLDMTGGFGVDAFYFAKQCGMVYHIEQNDELSAIAEHNSSALGATNIRFLQTDSIHFLKSGAETFDTIYVDPARRIQTRKVFLLKDTEPDVVSHLPLLLSKASRIIIKTSPLFDIQSGLKELHNVSGIHIVSIKNDCKELLWIIDRDFIGEPLITCTALGRPAPSSLTFRYSGEKQTQLSTFSDPQEYLYEPDVALLKAGCFKITASEFGLTKLHPNTHLYTSDRLNSAFIGRIFKVTGTIDYADFAKSKTPVKANISIRNFPLSVDALKKKHKLRDGGDKYLIFTTGAAGQRIVIEAVRQEL
ncbi:hypothetical protein BDE36_2123 [Arcticibacter tournemirensis]|uniref:Uncharacterized protein n=1 Tax=Arcticibacter tournemirensis TaxID=699437 RepID=A0A4Q0MAL1_9SPHI|nr:class I SAM-dependent methyltransferase [Arcticibacter tournemirensis]KAA8485335.1 hypothetical protein F1649_04240 [Arcticibacter tournemirensis]RXF70033.1 hypothetical protein EKH83_09085 [Arcticibacter tournemirensis]TQM50379.1 hypothetical protein BDE36_2123 [Arcticibacter tournemirensis]